MSSSKSAAVSSAESAVTDMEKNLFEMTKDKQGNGFVMKPTTSEATFKNYMQKHFPGADQDIDDLWQEA
jgi:hypothetical protein